MTASRSCTMIDQCPGWCASSCDLGVLSGGSEEWNRLPAASTSRRLGVWQGEESGVRLASRDGRGGDKSGLVWQQMTGRCRWLDTLATHQFGGRDERPAGVRSRSTHPPQRAALGVAHPWKRAARVGMRRRDALQVVVAGCGCLPRAAIGDPGWGTAAASPHF